jgi:beta-galactosidase
LTTSFNHDWHVKPKVNRFLELAGGQTTAPEPITLPHDAMIGTERSPAGSHMNAYFPDGVWEYTKSFEAPDEWRDRRVRLLFEGVYRDAQVFVNDDFAGGEPNGYSEFVIDLDPFLRYGESNIIKVECQAGDDSRWYSGAGIYRPVQLWVQPRVHLGIDGITVTTPEVDERIAVVEIAAEVENETPHTVTTLVEFVVTDNAGNIVAAGNVPVTLRPHVGSIARHRLVIRDPALWGLDEPILYDCTVTVTTPDGMREQQAASFGIRRLSLDPVHGLRINGETVKLRGACVHHDNGPIGAATIDRAEERRVELLKAAGFNAIRSAHNPASRSMLAACDRLGLAVMDEAWDMWNEGKRDGDHALRFADRWRIDMASMVRKDRNHPSVVMYSTGNEIPEVGSPLGAALARDIAEYTRSVDPTRYVTNAVQPFLAIRDLIARVREFLPKPGADNSADTSTDGGDTPTGVNSQMTSWAQIKDAMMASPMVGEAINEVCASLDIAGYNYLDTRYAIDADLHPNRVIVGSETYVTAIARAWPLIMQSGNVIGDFTWTGWDYIGEVGVGRTEFAGDRDPTDGTPQFMAPYPWVLGHTGDLDVTGFRRPQSYFREIVFGLRDEPYIAVRRPVNLGKEITHAGPWAWSDTIGSWTWPDFVGVVIPVEVYSGADEIELFQDGVLVGRRPAGPDHAFVARFDVTYAPGELVAVAFTGGAEVGRHVLRTATGPRRLQAEVDRTTIVADDRDLVYVTVAIVDGFGTIDASTDLAVRIELEGPAFLQGFASADPRSMESYRSATTTTYEGRAVAVVRPTGAGPISIRAMADDLDPTSVVVTAELAS